MSKRKKTILPTGLILAAVSVNFLVLSHKYHTSFKDQLILKIKDTFNSTFNSVQKFSFEANTHKIDKLLSNAPDIVTAFTNRDKVLFYQKTKYKYTNLTSQYAFFKKMYFHLVDGTTLLRIHKPDYYAGDLTDVPPIVVSMHEDKKTLCGYSIERNGLFYRIVHPIFDNKYIGGIATPAEYNSAVTKGKNLILTIRQFGAMTVFQESSITLEYPHTGGRRMR